MLITDRNAAGKVSRRNLRALVESTKVVRHQYRVCKSNQGFVELLSDVDTLPHSGVWHREETQPYCDHTTHSHSLGVPTHC